MTTQPEITLAVPSGRFQYVDIPSALPGVCIVCGSVGGVGSDGRKFIDFGFSVDYYGQVYFCSFCFVEALGPLGWSTPERVEHYKGMIAEQKELNQRLEAENVKLRSVLHQLKLLGVNVSDNIPDNEPLESATDAIELEGRTNTEPAKQADVSGLSDVQVDDTDPLFATGIDDL